MSARHHLERLLLRQNLSEDEAAALLRELTSPELPPPMAGALLIALRAKGVTAEEVRGLAGAMRELARKPALAAAPDAIDIVGTGGDSSGSFNLSTGAALLTAACGVPVIKHGNRSLTSRSGAADLLEALGVRIPMDEREAAACFAATGFTFLFAPYYHPAMKVLAPTRSALGVRTVFNLLGPLTNPASPRFLLLGAYDQEAAELMAATLVGMAVERAWVVHGAAGWDEATPIGPFVGFEVSGRQVRRLDIDPEKLGMPRCSAQDLKGGDAQSNLRAMLEVFNGHDRGAHRAALLLQTGMALMIAGRAQDIVHGINTAASTIDSGRAAVWLNELRAFAKAAA
jgi:anthranilate phosphoribosyltransferase